MKRTILLVCLLGFVFAPSAMAQDAQLKVEPGLWVWNYQAIIGDVPLTRSSNECVRAEDSQAALSTLIRGLDNGCQVKSVEQSGDKISFSMACSGKIPGQAKGVLTMAEKSLKMDASGFANAFGFMAPFKFKAQADHKGAC